MWTFDERSVESLKYGVASNGTAWMREVVKGEKRIAVRF